jgi:hypothetical protein
MKCIICNKKLNILEIEEDDEEFAMDSDNPICPKCFRLVLSNEYIKRVFKEWEDKL